LLALLALWYVSALDGRASFSDHPVLATTGGVLALLLVVNIALGPTCHTVLLTALGPQRLFSLSRMRPARRALHAIRTGVDAVQGALPPDEAVRLVDQAQASQSGYRQPQNL
ncbi:MAG: hypothetical protein INR64_11400, partial [Caulobacteraceae bacterium]|nr:hypothetical protein [Caulobacter sp.]